MSDIFQIEAPFISENAVGEFKEFAPLLRGPALRGISSRELGWKGFIVEQHCFGARELPEAVADRHIVSLWYTGGILERANERGIFSRYSKPRGSLTLIVPGVVPAARPRSYCQAVSCALDAQFVQDIEDQLDQRPAVRPMYRTSFQDETLRRLVMMLAEEVAGGGTQGPLYADHLAHALAMRLLFLGVSNSPKGRTSSPLPRIILGRVTERMRALDTELNLNTLAAESGYSRTHFIRMFRAATGYTPHHYLLRLRVERAQQLLKEGRRSLIDIAAFCGFSSHSHMSKIFRQFLGVSPDEYRRTT